MKSKISVSDAISEALPGSLQPKKRCAWVTPNTDPRYAAFHDEEWGLPVHDDKKLFELLIFSGALAELTCPMILKKRHIFREVSADFDPISVAKFSEKKIAAPRSTASSLLSELKLRAIVENARNIEGSNNQDLSVNVGKSASSHNVLRGNAISAMDVDVTVNMPFALVDEIAEASPAAEDGLQLGDQIVKFGNVESGDDLLPKLASEALSNQDREIPVVVLRQDVISESYDHLHGALMNSDASVRPARRQCPSRCVLTIHSLFASP
ncbi:DNA-3-methyladenine glycosylase 1 [Camellia lanceoleosa]|uniref:DNA-3-methyladenine glycosylase 1 n=1 Tax=Camellia lanceoleosa TaxID=1840588 RepID=A0ACC0H3Q4_9ERIC|nr:DNA-3-methyladenine glycosylase 1 [Camellia lanceoleosa]